MIKRHSGFTPLERNSYHLNGIRKYIARMWLKSQPNFQTGFTLVELLVAMVMFTMVITAATSVFVPLLTTHKQQSKITETNIEGIVGLDILRRDIEHAGYGLPWDLGGANNYFEAIDYGATAQVEQWYNDSPNNPPRALVSGDGDGDGGALSGDGSGSDVLVIKSLIVATNDASQKWTHVNKNNIVIEWDPQKERLETNARVIVMIPGEVRKLKTSAGGFTTRYLTTTDPDTLSDTAFLPDDAEDTYIAYGVTPPAAGNLRMPFNRADYYVRTPLAMPERCAVGTGILYKGTLNHADGGLNELPLIDCVADMQVVYGVDEDEDGDFEPLTSDGYYADFSVKLTTAKDVRSVKQVRVSVLAHEGQKDPTFTFTNFTCAGNCITVGEFGLGRDFDNSELTAITDWANYRWKVYTLVVRVED